MQIAAQDGLGEKVEVEGRVGDALGELVELGISIM